LHSKASVATRPDAATLAGLFHSSFIFISLHSLGKQHQLSKCDETMAKARNESVSGLDKKFSDDWFLDGRLLLRQPVKGHRIGTDALLLAAITPSLGRICDLGAGVGAVGMAVLLREPLLDTTVVLVEREETFAELARHNLEVGRLKERVVLIEADVFKRKSFLAAPALDDQSFDAVATNPPYDQVLRGRHSPTALKSAAHAMQGGGLEEWLKSAVRLLKDGGLLTMIHRADRLDDVLAAMPRRAGAVVIRPVQPQVDQAATRILVQATAGSRAPLTLLPPLVLHDKDGQFTPEAEALHKGRARLLMQSGPFLQLL
jgi:tRNA1(Val) A37 N6-methylase TrmN6